MDLVIELKQAVEENKSYCQDVTVCEYGFSILKFQCYIREAIDHSIITSVNPKVAVSAKYYT